MEEQLTIDILEANSLQIILHPLVPINEQIVVGSLLGYIQGNKVFITNSYSVQYEYNDDDTFAIDQEDHKTLFQYNQKICDNLILIGAFVTKNEQIDLNIAYLCQEYAKKDNHFINYGIPPVVLSVTGFEQGNMDIKAYVINQNLKDFANVASFNKMNVTISFTNESPHQALNIINMTDQQDVEDLMQSLQRNLHLALEQKVNSEAMSEVVNDIARIFKSSHEENKVSSFITDLVLLNKRLGEKITVI